MNESPVRLYYAAGPGDIAGSFRHWLNGSDDPGQFARTYSAQFFDVAAAAGAEALAVSSCERAAEESGGGITAVNRPLSSGGRGGKLDFLKRQVEAAWNLWRDLLRFRPDAAVIAEGTTFWMLIAPLRLLGIRLVPSIHCVLWPPQVRRSWKRRIFDRVETLALRMLSAACLSASAIIDRQLPRGLKARRFLPSYRRDCFAQVPPADFDAEPLRLLYAGRIEGDKGVFDLLDALRIVRSRSDLSLHLDFCGSGSALGELDRRIGEHGLEGMVSLHGHCSSESFRRRLGSAHILVVPTTSRFVEGFNQVVVEGFLAGRPVVATSVCPSAHELGRAVTVVPPDSPEALGDAIEALAADPYPAERAGRGGAVERSAFFDDSLSWRSQLWRALRHVLDGAERTIAPENENLRRAPDAWSLVPES